MPCQRLEIRYLLLDRAQVAAAKDGVSVLVTPRPQSFDIGHLFGGASAMTGT